MILSHRVLPGERTLGLVVGPGAPRGGEAAVADDPRVVGQVLGDEVAVGELGAQLVDDLPEVPAVDLGGHVEPEPVGPVLLEVHAGVLVEVVADLALPPRRADAPPGVLAALAVDPALVGVAVVVPQHVVAVAEVVVDDVEDHREAGAVGGVDEVPQLCGRAVRRLGREPRRGVVAPGAVHRVLLHRQRLDAAEAQLLDVAELALDLLEGRPLDAVLVAAPGEGADVELVDQEVLEARRVERRPRVGTPVRYEGGVAAVADRPGELGAEHVARRRVEPFQDLALGGGDPEPVKLPGRHARHRRTPVVVRSPLQGLRGGGAAGIPLRPVLHGDRHGRRMRGPDPEEGPSPV